MELPAGLGWGLLLALCRVGPLLLGVPLLGWGGRLLLLGAAMALVGPLLMPSILANLGGMAVKSADLWQLAPLFWHELGIGGLLLCGALLPWAWLRSAGRLLDEPGDATLRQLGEALALSLFFALGGATLLVTVLGTSYAVMPLPALGKPTLAFALPARDLLAASGRLFALALALALPVLSARLVAEFGLGLLLRTLRAPVGSALLAGNQGAWAPLRSLIVLLTLALGLGAMVSTWTVHFRAFSPLFKR